MVMGTRMPYHINEGSERDKQLLNVLRTLIAAGDEINIKQLPNGSVTVTVNSESINDLSMNRALERVGRAFTTVFDR